MPDPTKRPKAVCSRCYCRFCRCDARYGLVKMEDLLEKRPPRTK